MFLSSLSATEFWPRFICYYNSAPPCFLFVDVPFDRMADSGFTLNKEKLAQLQARSAAVRTGGKGSVRRKKKSDHKPGATDDKRLQGILKGLRMGPIDGIDEANLFKDNGMVIHFNQPKGESPNRCASSPITYRADWSKRADFREGVIFLLPSFFFETSCIFNSMHSRVRNGPLFCFVRLIRCFFFPTVQAANGANTFVISGNAENKGECTHPYSLLVSPFDRFVFLQLSRISCLEF